MDLEGQEMSRDLSKLRPEFHDKVNCAISRCKNNGVIIVPFFTDRDIKTQAKLYRQSRTWKEISQAINHLEDNKAYYLAKILREVGPQNGRWATNALPGLSWHQHGLAVDCFVLENGKAIWDSKHPGYEMMAVESRYVGLYTGYYWDNPDPVHTQLYKKKVLNIYTLEVVNELMKVKYGENKHGN